MATASSCCPICVETFQRTPARKEVKCHLCEYIACAGCCQTYLLGSIQDAHCMNCRRTWSREFMINSFTQVFMNTTYKKHREDILMAREKSLLPLRMEKIERMNRGKAMIEEIKPLYAEVEAMRAALLKLERMYYHKINTQNMLLQGVEPGASSNTQKKDRVVEFHKPCPATDCRGFLSTQYKCGLCSIWVCPDCYEIKGDVKEADHTCKPENVESVKLKKKQCKNCPECGAEIYKEIGCDQMWCTQCETTFDWKTGTKLVNVKIHNPHYYEYLRRTQGSVPRDPDDRQGAAACYNNHEVHMSIARIASRYSEPTVKHLINNSFIEANRVINHISDVEVPRYNLTVTDTTNEDIDIQYLRKEIDEKSWKQILQNREKQRLKKQDILQILQMIVQAGQDILLGFVNRWILEVRKKDDEKKLIGPLIEDIWKQLEGLRALANESFKTFAVINKCQAPLINLVAFGANPEKNMWEFKLRHKHLV